MIEPQFPFESDDEYKHRVVLDKLHEGIELTEEEQKLLESIPTAGDILFDEDYQKLYDIEDKLARGIELTEEEEEFYVSSAINGGDNTLGATT